MKIQHIFFLIITLSGQFVLSQNDIMIYPIDSIKGEYSFDAYYDISSNSITSGFFKKLYNGEHISYNDKVESSLNLGEANRFGAEISSNFNWTSPLSLFQNWHPTIGFGYRQIASLGFTNDFYDLVFYGNTRFKGENAVFSNSHINYLHYQSVQFGLRKKIGNTDFQFNLGLVKGSQGLQTTISNGQLFTGENGDYLDLNLNAQLAMSDSNKTGLQHWSGSGFVANVAFSYDLNDKSTVNFSLENIGHIAWNTNNSSYQIDSSFHWEGATVDNIFNLTDSVFQIETNSDSLINGYETISDFTSLIPARIFVSYNYRNENIGLRISLDHMLNTSYIPHLQAASTINLNNNFGLMINLGYGGFTNFHYGSGFFLNFDHFKVNLLCNALNGLISNSGRTQTATLKLRYLI